MQKLQQFYVLKFNSGRLKKDDYKINMWVCLDKDILINVTKNNVDDIIRYLYERFPY